MSFFGHLHSKLSLLGVILPLAALLIACTGGAEGRGEMVVQATVVLPTPTLRPTLTPTPTPTRFTLVSVEEVLAPLRVALQNYQTPEEDRALLIQAFRRTVGSFLVAAPHPLTQSTVETLTTGLEGLAQPPANGTPLAVMADLDQDGEPDLVLGLPWMLGLPAFAFLSSQHYTGVALPALENGEAADDLLNYAWPAMAQVEDITGEGQPELVVGYTAPGGSGVTDRVYAFRWQPETQALAPIFQATLISWAAEASWELQPSPGGSQAFVLQGPAFGPFDHKLLPHPTETQIWQWDGAAGQFIQAEGRVSEPETPRQQFNLAESLLRQGEYEAAIPEFEKVLTLDPGPELATLEDSATDWAALAHLRLGQTYALLGQPEAAWAELAQAQAAGSIIGALADAFQEGYEEGEVVAAWAAMMEEVNLEELLYNESDGNLGFPVEPFGFYYPGLAVAAYLDQHPEVIEGPVEQLVTLLALQGFSLRATMILDMSGDGRPELVFVRRDPAQDMDRLWLAYQEAGRWRAALLTEWDHLMLEGGGQLPGGEPMLLVTFPSMNGRPPAGYGWSPDGAVVYNLEGDSPRAEARDPWPTLGGF